MTRFTLSGNALWEIERRTASLPASPSRPFLAVNLRRCRSSPCACATHGLFSGPAYERIANSSIEEVVVTNAVPVPLERQTGKVKVLSVGPLFAKTISNVYSNGSVASLFE